jgi:hypothetical protein
VRFVSPKDDDAVAVVARSVEAKVVDGENGTEIGNGNGNGNGNGADNGDDDGASNGGETGAEESPTVGTDATIDESGASPTPDEPAPQED